MERRLLLNHFRAPWGRSLILISLLAASISLAVVLWPVPSARNFGPGAIVLIVRVVLLAVLVGSALFAIRGYTVTPDSILIHRLLWATRLSRSSLESARFEPRAMRGSLRLFGNGGLFSFTGYFYSRLLGRYRAFVTDPQRTIVLCFRRGTVVISPDDPAAFVDAIAASRAGRLS